MPQCNLRLRNQLATQPTAAASKTVAADERPSTLYQAVLTDFIREGHFARHIRRMRMLYMERCRALVKAISIQMGNMIEIRGAQAGMHLAALLPPDVSDAAASRNAARHGISVMPLSICYLKPPTRGGLILGYGAPTHIRFTMAYANSG